MIRQSLFRQIIQPLETVLLLFLLLFFLIIKVLFVMYANPLPDEAYYWLWSKNIALSYFDHPPLVAWVQAALLPFSNNKYFVIRALPLLSLGIVVITMIFWQHYILRKLNYFECLRSVTLFLGFPVFAIFFSISFPDYLLITFLFLSAFCLFLFFERNEIYYWYLAAFLFSLALLTKYNAILLGVGVLIYISFYKNKVKGPSTIHIIIATILILLMQSPVFFWNLKNDFASFSFHLNERLDDKAGLNTILKNIAGFLSGAIVAFSPIFILNLKHKLIFGKYGDNTENFFTMGKFILVFSITFCIFLSFFTNVLYYWVIPAVVLFIPFLNDVLKKKLWQYFHLFYGVLISLILFINISFYPISAIFGSVDRETAILFGWDKIIKVVGEEKKKLGIEEVVFSDYRLGSLYIFHSGDFDVDVIMEERNTQFDIWRAKDKQFTTNTLIITDDDFPVEQKILSSFQSIQFVQDIYININKKFVKKYQVFLGTNK